MRILKVILPVLFVWTSGQTFADDLDATDQEMIEVMKQACVDNPDKFLSVITNPEMRTQIKGRRYKPFCTCFANLHLRLTSDLGRVHMGGKPRFYPEFAQRYKTMKSNDIDLVTYRQCVRLVIEKMP